MSKDTHISHFINNEQRTEVKEIYSLGADEISKLLEGVRPGELCVFYGDIASGKTALSIRMLDYQSIDNGVPSLFFCVRDTPESIVHRLIGYRCSIPYRSFQVKKDSVDTEILLQQNQIAKSPIYLYQSQFVMIDDVCDICKQHVDEFGVKIVFLHCLYIGGKDKALRLRLLARELGIVIVLLVNQLIFGEGIYGFRPCLKDLGEDNLNEYGDIIIGLCDYERYHLYQDASGRDLRGLIHVEILKSRDGLPGGEYYTRKDYLHLKNYVAPHLITPSWQPKERYFDNDSSEDLVFP
jgi:replicative DNA helicase